MAKPYSIDLRERVISAVMQGAPQRFGIGASTVITWMQRWRDNGHIKPGQMGGHRPKKIAAVSSRGTRAPDSDVPGRQAQAFAGEVVYRDEISTLRNPGQFHVAATFRRCSVDFRSPRTPPPPGHWIGKQS